MGGGPIGILFSLVVIVIATLNLIVDYDFILKNVSDGAPKYMEWYSALRNNGYSYMVIS